MIAKAGIPAVAYYRMSNNKQEASIPTQREAVERYAGENGYTIIREYNDAGISGWKSEQRVEFQRLIADAPRGEFAAVLCWDIDRFSRFPPLEANYYWFILDSAGVQLASVSQGVLNFDDLGSWLAASVTQFGKSEFVRDISRNSMRGRIAAAKRGEWNSQPPTGYIVKNKRLAMGDESDIQLVRRLFREYLGGKSLRGIAETLNGEGVKSRKGTTWSGNSVRQILKNQAYLGRFVWNKSSAGKFYQAADGKTSERSSTGHQRNDESDWIVFEDHHPAIIDRKTFDGVQDALQDRRHKTTPVRNGGRYVLSGILRCGSCGGPMHGSPNRSKLNYCCSSYNIKGRAACNPHRVEQGRMVELIADKIQDVLLSPANIKRLKAALRRQTREAAKGLDATGLRRSLKSVELKIGKAGRRLVEVDPDMVETVQGQLRELRSDRDRIQVSLTAAESPRKRLDIEQADRIDRAVAAVSRLREVLRDGNPLLVREAIAKSVQRVDLNFREEKRGKRNRYILVGGQMLLNSSILSSLLSATFYLLSTPVGGFS